MKLKTAFTLIELLVVIAIIGILSGLIVVSMGGMTDKANIAKSQIFSNSLRNSLMSNLISEWKFDGSGVVDGGTATAEYILDSWNSSNSCALTGHPDVYSGTNCISGSCLQFNGTTDSVDCGNILQLGKNSWTYSLWFKGSSFPSTTNYLITKTDNGATAYRMALGFDSNQKINFILRDSANQHYGFEDADVINFYPDNKWHNIVIVINRSSNLLCYLDGVIMGSRNISAIANQNFNLNRPFRIGAYTTTLDEPNSYFNGMIDEVRIFNSAMPTSQIKEQYYSGLNNLLANGGINQEEYVKMISSLAVSN